MLKINTSLSAYEMQLVTDAQALITKNLIIKKVSALFADLAEEYKKELENTVFDSDNFINPKISRGENYLSLPYVILDFPRQFGKTDVFAIRSFFWWGNFFSITLQLAGRYHAKFYSNIENAINKNRFAGWYISTSENQWEHHFESNNYIPVKEGTKYNLSEQSFLKLAKKIPLAQWDETNVFYTKNFKLIMETLLSMPQSGETDLLPGTPTTGFDL